MRREDDDSDVRKQEMWPDQSSAKSAQYLQQRKVSAKLHCYREFNKGRQRGYDCL